ncbi:MAG: hypothetical protein PHV30_07460 [Candidatus Margulisbacteria bacterium]|nr:hypothetical protein [Candidatus Margulisiibacteriota bacterium]
MANASSPIGQAGAPAAPPPPQAAKPPVSESSGFSWGSILKKGLFAAILGGLCALFPPAAPFLIVGGILAYDYLFSKSSQAATYTPPSDGSRGAAPMSPPRPNAPPATSSGAPKAPGSQPAAEVKPPAPAKAGPATTGGKPPEAGGPKPTHAAPPTETPPDTPAPQGPIAPVPVAKTKPGEKGGERSGKAADKDPIAKKAKKPGTKKKEQSDQLTEWQKFYAKDRSELDARKTHKNDPTKSAEVKTAFTKEYNDPKKLDNMGMKYILHFHGLLEPNPKRTNTHAFGNDMTKPFSEAIDRFIIKNWDTIKYKFSGIQSAIEAINSFKKNNNLNPDGTYIKIPDEVKQVLYEMMNPNAGEKNLQLK